MKPSTTEVIALHRLVYNDADGNQAEATPETGAFDLPSDQVETLVSLNAVRRVSPLDHDKDGSVGGSVDDLDQLKLHDLKALAATEKVGVSRVADRGDIIEAIREARLSRGAVSL